MRRTGFRAMAHPVTKYVQNPSGLHISYWSFGDGPLDLIYVPNFVSNTDLMWLNEWCARFMQGLGSICRTTAFDTSGTGNSDPIPADALPTMEQWMDDVRVVMDAEGIERATLLGHDAGGPLAALFAATHPERTTGLVLFGCYAKLMRAEDHPWGIPDERAGEVIDRWLGIWGTGTQLAMTAPSLAEDAAARDSIALFERSVKMSMRRPLFEMIQHTDVREVLPAVRVPTLVMHRAGDRYIPVEHGRYLAGHIAGARYVELPGDDHYPFVGDVDAVLDEIREFVTGERHDPGDIDRVLATLLFTDIVDSTARASAMGDKAWRELLDRHDTVVRSTLERFRGREVKALGDGFLATFDGPARAIRCAAAIGDGVRALGLDVRTGLHTGEIELRGDDVGGIAVHIGARVMARARPGEILVSAAVPPLVAGSGLRFADRGAAELKGIDGTWQLYAVTP